MISSKYEKIDLLNLRDTPTEPINKLNINVIDNVQMNNAERASISLIKMVLSNTIEIMENSRKIIDSEREHDYFNYIADIEALNKRVLSIESKLNDTNAKIDTLINKFDALFGTITIKKQAPKK